MLLAAFLEGAHRVCLFSAALYIGQPVGVSLVAPVIDRYGATPVFFMVGILLPALGLWFAGRLAHGKRSIPIFERGEHTGAMPGRLIRAGPQRSSAS
jgi:hypothetical protein